MEFWVRCNTKYTLSIFFTNTTNEGKARQQCRMVKERLGNILKDKGVTHMMGSHFYKCYNQCGFPEVENDNQSHCITDDCEYQIGSRFYGKCLLFSSVADYLDRNQTAFNHLHILIHALMASKEAWEPVVQHATPKSVNKDLENVSNMVREFFDPKSEKHDSFIYKKGERDDESPPAADYMFLQKHVFWPLSIYANSLRIKFVYRMGTDFVAP